MILPWREDRVYRNYAIGRKGPIADQLDVLIQRSVESGILQFYKGMEAFLRKLRLPSSGVHSIHSDFITMDHAYLYIYGFFIGNGLCVVVFFGEILYFHRKKIKSCLRHGGVATLRMLRRIKNETIHNRVWRFLGRGIVAAQGLMKKFGKRLFHMRIRRFSDCRIATKRQVMQRIKNCRNAAAGAKDLHNKLRRFFGHPIAATQRLMQRMRMRNRQTRIHPFQERN